MKNTLLIGCALFLLVNSAYAAPQAGQDTRNEHARKLLQDGKSLIDQNQYDKAIAAFDEAINLEPQWAAVYLELGRVYSYKLYERRDATAGDKARAALRKAIALEPGLAEAHYVMGRVEFLSQKYDEALSSFELALKADPALVKVYGEKWRAMLKRPDFESMIPKIRAEIDSLLERLPDREAALSAALSGFEIIADEAKLKQVQDRLIADFPKSRAAENILLQRLFEERDDSKRAALIDSFIARYPQNRNRGFLLELLFEIRARQTGMKADELLRLGETWIEAAAQSADDMSKSRSTVVIVLAERRMALDRAQVLADETVKLLDEMKPDSPLLKEIPQGDKAKVMELYKERAHEARGLLLLRRGNVEAAAKELPRALQRVMKEVELNSYILWKDSDLRKLDVRPRVLWLAEYYEMLGDYNRAVKYQLAGACDDEAINKLIRERLAILYEKLGRKAADADKELLAAQTRYRSLMAASAVSSEGSKQKYLAHRLGTPAPEFKALGLDKKEVRLSDFKGKVVVLNFWATWCGPCVREMPHWQKAVDNYKNQRDVVFLAVSIDENRPAVRPFLEKNGYSFGVAYDQDGAQSFQIPGVPTTLIIDRQGVIQFRDVGFGEETLFLEHLAWRIDALLSEPGAPATPSTKEKSQ